MAGLGPATQCAHVGARWKRDGVVGLLTALRESFGRADARPLGGRVKPGHDGREGADRHWLSRIGAGLIMLLCLVSLAHAVEPDEKLADPALEARARALTAELRCVVCQNQSVDDSDAPLAKDIRVLVRERIMAGDSDEDVLAYIVARYGRFVLLKPPLSGDTALLWFGPGILLVLGLALAFLYVRRLNRAPAAPLPLSPAEEDAVKKIMEDPRV
jgi:cytochrome c-type biogenesis protein CcmH